MQDITNRQVYLSSRPTGVPHAGNFSHRVAEVPALAEGQILIRNHYLSADPAMRGWISDVGGYWPQIAIGETMRAFAVGEVIKSRLPEYTVGDRLMGIFGWQEYAAVSDKHVLLKVPDGDRSLSLYLGVLGLNGLTAYFGLLDVGAPKEGDTVVVSTAAGAVGSCVGQIAKLRGCRTVGIAGGATKARQCLEEFGYDAAIDYKSNVNLDEALQAACPNGVDVYFDNTSGPISDAVMRRLRIGARIVICGTAAYASWNPWNSGPRPERHLIVKRARMQGFLATDYAPRYQDAVLTLANWVKRGEIRYAEEILEGIERAPESIERLYRGEHTGKLLIKLPAAES
jgi:NADPH-dependent curcumin reductase CurA